MMGHMDPRLAHVVSASAAALIAAIFEGAVLAGLTALCLRLLPALSSTARSYVWTAVFAIAVLLPFAPVTSSQAVGSGAAQAELQVGVVWALAGVGLWAALSLVRAMLLARSAWHLRGVARRAVPIDLYAELDIPVETVAGRRVELCSTSEVEVPCVAGFFRPRVLLPPDVLSSMSAADLRQIVLHEMEHLRRHDDWTNLLQKVGLVLFPLNPVLFWLERRLCEEREMACDDGVLAATGAGKAYASCLAKLAEHALMRRGVSLALGAWQRQSELARRVHRILRKPEQSTRRGVAAASAGVALAGVLGATAVLARAPHLVNFEDQVALAAAAPAPTAQAAERSAAVIPAVSRVWPASQPTLVKAVMPERRAAKVTAVQKRAVVHRVHSAAPARHCTDGAPWVVMTRYERSAPAGIVLAVSEDSQFTYAAVPVTGGWLVVQL